MNKKIAVCEMKKKSSSAFLRGGTEWYVMSRNNSLSSIFTLLTQKNENVEANKNTHLECFSFF